MNTSTRVWSATSTSPVTERTSRGANVSAMAVLDVEVDGPRLSGGPIHHVTAGKRRTGGRMADPSRSRTHVIESWTRRVGDPDPVFNAPNQHEMRRLGDLGLLG